MIGKKKLKDGGRKIEALNDKSRASQTKRVRERDDKIITEIKRLRREHPNLGKDKLRPELKIFCNENNLEYPEITTVGRIKRAKKLRKPKDLKALYHGHMVALDFIEKRIKGNKIYIITFENIYTRFTFAWSTKSHASQTTKEFFRLCLKMFPFLIALEFTEVLKQLHLTHYHTYPRTPKMNAHLERFNRTIQDEFVDFHMSDLLIPQIFNNKVIDYLIWYDTRRVHHAFKNKLSPTQFILSEGFNLNLPQECRVGWTHTRY